LLCEPGTTDGKTASYPFKRCVDFRMAKGHREEAPPWNRLQAQ
jgi:hypothetical protein